VQAAGRANGVVNIGGFVASLCTIGLIGVVLDLRSHGTGHYTLGDFRVAMAVQFVFWGVGALQIWRYRRKAIAHLHRVHPGAVEMLRRGETFVHPGISAATQMASITCSGLAPLRIASFVCPWMQYGHWVVWATATAISCLVTSSIAPSAKTALLNAVKASWVRGASSLRRRCSSGVVGW
jgi:hypothetical protein